MTFHQPARDALAMQTRRATDREVAQSVGKRFGRRVVLEVFPRLEAGERTMARVVVRCDCGKLDVVAWTRLKAGHARQCVKCAQQRKSLPTA